MLCYVMLCYVMLCYVMLCYVMLCYVMLCYVMLCMYVCMYVYMVMSMYRKIPIAMCHSCRVQQHPIAEVARRPWSRMCLGPQWAVLSTKKKQFTNVYRIRIIHPKGQCFYVLRGKMMINHRNFVLQKYFSWTNLNLDLIYLDFWHGDL